MFLIILAHSNPPFVLFELRNFDVSLMVFLVGMSFSVSSSKYKSGKATFNGKYFFHRLKRLVLPVWLFLTIYFLIENIFFKVDYKEMLSSFLLISGIGYVWFIRILVVFALLGPLLLIINKKFGDKAIFLICLISWMLSTTLSGFYGVNRALDIFLLDWLGFLPLFALGMCIRESSRKVLLSLVVLLAIYLIIKFCDVGFISFQDYKYPPNGIYVIYGILISTLLYLVVSYHKFASFFENRLILFFSSNSMWLYLIHIPFVILCHSLAIIWYLAFPFILFSSFFIVYIKNILIKKYFNSVGSFVSILKG